MAIAPEHTDTHGHPAEVRDLPLHLVRPPATNVRVDLTGIDELAASIRHHGVLSAVTVRPTEDGGYEVVAGARRREAALRAGLASIPAVVRRDLGGSVGALAAQIAENLERIDLTDGEVIAGVQQLLELGATDEQLAGTGVVGADEADTLRAVVALGPVIHERIADGSLSIAQAAAFVPLAGEEAYIERALMYLARGWEARQAVADVMEQLARDRRAAAAVEKLQARGVRVLERPGYGGPTGLRSLGKGHGQVAIDTRKHAKLPCHAAYVDANRRGDGIVYVCTNPRSHDTRRADAGHGETLAGPADTAQSKAAETRAQRMAWRARHADRFAFTTAMVRGMELDEAMRRVALDVMPRGEFGDEEAACIALQFLTGEQLGEGQPGAAARRLRELAAESGEAAIRAAAALLAGRAERAFLRPEGDYRQRDNVVAHFRVMLGHDYPLSAAEVWQLERGFSIRSMEREGDSGTPLARVLQDEVADLDGADDGVGSADDPAIAGTSEEDPGAAGGDG